MCGRGCCLVTQLDGPLMYLLPDNKNVITNASTSQLAASACVHACVYVCVCVEPHLERQLQLTASDDDVGEVQQMHLQRVQHALTGHNHALGLLLNLCVAWRARGVKLTRGAEMATCTAMSGTHAPSRTITRAPSQPPTRPPIISPLHHAGPILFRCSKRTSAAATSLQSFQYAECL